MYKSGENRGKFINFAKIEGKYAICIIGLRGTDAPAYNITTASSDLGQFLLYQYNSINIKQLNKKM